MNPCPFSVSFLKFAKWQTWQYIYFYELAAANLMVGRYLGPRYSLVLPALQKLPLCGLLIARMSRIKQGTK